MVRVCAEHIASLERDIQKWKAEAAELERDGSVPKATDVRSWIKSAIHVVLWKNEKCYHRAVLGRTMMPGSYENTDRLPPTAPTFRAHPLPLLFCYRYSNLARIRAREGARASVSPIL